MRKDSDKSLLSIIVPVHNISGRAENLKAWIGDALSANIKIIVVHDESQDSTQLELSEMLQVFNSDLISLHKINVQSPGLARNYGMDFISTPWFSFADADDFVNIANLILLLRETEAAGSEIGIGSYFAHDLISKSEVLISPSSTGKYKLALHLALNMGLWRFVFSSQELSEYRFSEHKMAEDYLFLAKILSCNKKVFIGSTSVYRYYFGGKLNLTSNKLVMIDMYDVLKLMQKVKPHEQLARDFKYFSLVKLAFSLFRNVRAKDLFYASPKLIFTIFSYPRYAIRLLLSKIQGGQE